MADATGIVLSCIAPIGALEVINLLRRAFRFAYVPPYLAFTQHSTVDKFVYDYYFEQDLKAYDEALGKELKKKVIVHALLAGVISYFVAPALAAFVGSFWLTKETEGGFVVLFCCFQAWKWLVLNIDWKRDYDLPLSALTLKGQVVVNLVHLGGSAVVLFQVTSALRELWKVPPSDFFDRLVCGIHPVTSQLPMLFIAVVINCFVPISIMNPLARKKQFGYMLDDKRGEQESDDVEQQKTTS